MRKWRNLDGGGTPFAALGHHKAATQYIVGILILCDLIDWEGFRPVLEAVTGYDTKNWAKEGRPPFNPFLLSTLGLLGGHSFSKDK